MGRPVGCAFISVAAAGNPTLDDDLAHCRERSAHVLLAAYYGATSPSFDLLAVGRAAYALRPTEGANTAYAENGAFWYNLPGDSAGFAASEDVSLDKVCPLSLRT